MAIADPAARSAVESGVSGTPAALRRPLSGAAPEHRDVLDGLRVIAAALVLAANVGGASGLSFTGSPASWVTARGDVGVPLFFALSGFLLYRPWAAAAIGGAAGPQLRDYLRRRVLRIVPAYWVVVTVALITFNPAHARAVWAWLQYLFLAQVYDPHPWWSGTGAAGLGQMWSLSADVAFYALLPALAALLAVVARLGGQEPAARARLLLVATGLLAACSYGYLVLAYRPGSTLPWLGATLPALLTWFAAGMALAVVSAWSDAEPGFDGPVRTFGATVAACALPCALVAAALFVIACTPVAGPETFGFPSLWQAEVKTALYTLIALAVVGPAVFQTLAPTPMSKVLGGPVMRGLGRISYGIFLWQGVVILAMFRLLPLRHMLAATGRFLTFGVAGLYVLVAAGTCMIAAVSYFLVERPALRWPGRPAGRPDSGQPDSGRPD